MRPDRLLTILIHLEAVRRTTTAELAALTEVSQRTAHRDVAALQAAGVPLWTEVGPNGGVRVLDGWRSGLDGLSMADVGSLEARLLAGFAPEGRAGARQIRERFVLDVPGWFHAEEDVPWLAAIAAAVWSQRRVDLRYGRSAPGVARRVDPLGLVLKAGTWYLVARHRGQVRSYRASRVHHAAARAESFERPPGFELAGWWQRSTSEFDRSILRSRVTLRLSPRGRSRLPAAMPSEAVLEALAALDLVDGGLGTPDHDGWVTVEVPTEGDDVAVHQLLALGAEVEVLDPPGVRSGLAAAALAIAALNR